MSFFISRLVFIFCGLVAIGNSAEVVESNKATVTCDFREVAKAKTGFAALGKLEFQIDLQKEKVPTKCLSKECALDGGEGDLELIANLDVKENPPVLFSRDNSEVSLPKLLIWGSNGDDSELLVVLNYDSRSTLTLFEDGNIDQSTKPVKCEVKLIRID